MRTSCIAFPCTGQESPALRHTFDVLYVGACTAAPGEYYMAPILSWVPKARPSTERALSRYY